MCRRVDSLKRGRPLFARRLNRPVWLSVFSMTSFSGRETASLDCFVWSESSPLLLLRFRDTESDSCLLCQFTHTPTHVLDHVILKHVYRPVNSQKKTEHVAKQKDGTQYTAHNTPSVKIWSALIFQIGPNSTWFDTTRLVVHNKSFWAKCISWIACRAVSRQVEFRLYCLNAVYLFLRRVKHT